jgi:hypothetical protein
MLGLALEIPSHRFIESEPHVHTRPEPALVSISSRSGRAGGDFSRQAVDEHFGHLRFPLGGVRIRDGSIVRPSWLINMAEAMGKSLISWDWATIAATPRTSRKAPRAGVGSPGRCCANRASVPTVAARGTGLFHSGRLDQAAKTRRPPAPRGEIRCRNGYQALERTLDSSHRPLPINGVTT